MAWAGAISAGEPLVTKTAGDLPIVLTAPHGGSEALANTPPRQPTGARSFVVVRDTNTAELTERIAAALEQETGKRPYMVIARFHRKYADANRSATDAYDHPNGKKQYDAFHESVRDAVDDVRRRWGRGILIDVHGQIARADAIYRGTRDGKTVSDLLAREGAGRAALIGPHSVMGLLNGAGYAVLPAIPESTDADAGIGHEDRFNGGFIVFAYGSHRPDGIDAMQMEFGTDLRKKARLDRTATDTAHAIAVFTRTFLPLNERSTQAAPD